MRKIVLFFVVAILLIAAVAQADVVLYYDFEENPTDQAAGVVRDQSGYGNDGAVEVGWPGYGEAPSYITSHDGSQAMLFGYSSAPGEGAGWSWNNIVVPKDASIANIGTMYSIAFWVRVDNTTNSWHEYPKVVSCPNYEIDLHASYDPASYFWPWDETYGNWDFAMANTNTYEGSWMHMAVTYDGTTFIQYINGIPVFSKADFATQFDDGTWDQDWAYWYENPMKIGTHADNPNTTLENGYLAGPLDDFAIWGNCYLDADMVAALYAGNVDPLSALCIPEPATLLLLGLGGVLLRRKRA